MPAPYRRAIAVLSVGVAIALHLYMGRLYYKQFLCEAGPDCSRGPAHRCDPGLEFRYGFCWRPEQIPEGYAYSDANALDSVRLRELVVDLAQLDKGMTVVEVGAGDGALLDVVLPKLGWSGRVVATDIDAAAVEKLQRENRSSYRGRVEVRLVRAFHSTGIDDLPDGSVDRIFLVNSMSFHSDGDRAADVAYLSAFRGKLAPDGRLLYHYDWLEPTQLGRESTELLLRDAGFRVIEEAPYPEHIPELATIWAAGRLGWREHIRRGFILMARP